MKKRLSILLSFVLALAMVVGVSACKPKDDSKVTVTIPENQKTLTLAEGDYKTITATASDGSEIEWTSSDDAVATVSDKGRVTAVKAGTATVTATAKGTEISDTCEVTVVAISILVGGQAPGSNVTLEMKSTLQLSVSATDNSTAQSWTSSDPEKATVSDSGLVTGVTPGEVTITVKTTSGVSATITITITASAGYTEITPESKGAGQWYYYTSSEGGRSTTVSSAYYDSATGVVNYNFSGNGNWYIDDIQLGHVAPAGTATGWKKVTGKITASDITTTGGDTEYYLTMHGTVVQFYEGDTTFSVCFEYNSGDDMFIRFGGNGVLVSGANFSLSDLVWAPHTKTTLAQPSFTLSGDDIAITDSTNTEGVLAYQIGLFKGEELLYAQNFDISGGKIDTSTVEVAEDVGCTVKIRALAQPGYDNSNWYENGSKYVIQKNDVQYDLENTGESGAQNSAGRWTYWAGDGGSVSSTPTYSNGTVTLESDYIGWAWYSTQLFRHYETISSPYVHLTFNINASHAGRITVNGIAKTLEAGDNEIDVTYVKPGGATISIQFGVNGEDPATNFPLETHLKFVITNVVVEGVETGGEVGGGDDEDYDHNNYTLNTAWGSNEANATKGKWGVWAGPGDWTSWTSVATIKEANYNNGTVYVDFKLEGLNGGNAWGLQFNYVTPDYVAGTSYSFDIVASVDMDIQVESGDSAVTHLTAGQTYHLTGGTDDSFYIQVNVANNATVEGSITITNVQWN